MLNIIASDSARYNAMYFLNRFGQLLENVLVVGLGGAQLRVPNQRLRSREQFQAMLLQSGPRRRQFIPQLGALQVGLSLAGQISQVDQIAAVVFEMVRQLVLIGRVL